jgi:hypothetical protein
MCMGTLPVFLATAGREQALAPALIAEDPSS